MENIRLQKETLARIDHTGPGRHSN